ncbi:hypothetical protein ACFYV5_22020 [Streptomyces sp. NPDC003035]|uniref:hypothetical protein n=1 Tax=unclassified Streptomyces TaxID=2593676 RepID=UPI0033AD680E
MPGGGFCKLPGGSVVVAIGLPSPAGDGATVRFLVHAANRARALTRLRNLGLRAVYLRGNAEPPTPDEVTAVLHHPDGILWRTAPHELWHSIRSLPKGPETVVAPRPTAPATPPPPPAAQWPRPTPSAALTRP